MISGFSKWKRKVISHVRYKYFLGECFEKPDILSKLKELENDSIKISDVLKEKEEMKKENQRYKNYCKTYENHYAAS